MNSPDRPFRALPDQKTEKTYWRKSNVNPYEFETSFIRYLPRDQAAHSLKPAGEVQVITTYHPTDYLLNTRIEPHTQAGIGGDEQEESERSKKAREMLEKRRLEAAHTSANLPGSPRVESRGYACRDGATPLKVSYRTTESGSPIHGYGAPRPFSRSRPTSHNGDLMPGSYPGVKRNLPSTSGPFESTLFSGFNVLKEQVSAWLPELPKPEEDKPFEGPVVYAPMSRMTRKRLEISRKERPAEDELERRHKNASAVKEHLEFKRLEELRLEEQRLEELRLEEQRLEELRLEEQRLEELRLEKATHCSTAESGLTRPNSQSSNITAHSKIEVPVLCPIEDEDDDDTTPTSRLFGLFRLPSFFRRTQKETVQITDPEHSTHVSAVTDTVAKPRMENERLPRSTLRVPQVEDTGEPVDFPFHLFRNDRKRSMNKYNPSTDSRVDALAKTPSGVSVQDKASAPAGPPAQSGRVPQTYRSNQNGKHTTTAEFQPSWIEYHPKIDESFDKKPSRVESSDAFKRTSATSLPDTLVSPESSESPKKASSGNPEVTQENTTVKHGENASEMPLEVPKSVGHQTKKRRKPQKNKRSVQESPELSKKPVEESSLPESPEKTVGKLAEKSQVPESGKPIENGPRSARKLVSKVFRSKKPISVISLVKSEPLKSNLDQAVASSKPKVEPRKNPLEKASQTPSEKLVWRPFQSFRNSAIKLADKFKSTSRKTKKHETSPCAIAGTSSEGPPVARASCVEGIESNDSLSVSSGYEEVISQPGVSETDLTRTVRSEEPREAELRVEVPKRSSAIPRNPSVIPFGVKEAVDRDIVPEIDNSVILGPESSHSSLQSSLDSSSAAVLSGSLWKIFKKKSKKDLDVVSRDYTVDSCKKEDFGKNKLGGLFGSLTKSTVVWRSDSKVKFRTRNDPGVDNSDDSRMSNFEGDMAEGNFQHDGTVSERKPSFKGILKTSRPAENDLLRIPDIDLTQEFEKAKFAMAHFAAVNEETMKRLKACQKEKRDKYRVKSLEQMQVFTAVQDELMMECEQKYHEYFANFEKIHRYLRLLVANLTGVAESFNETNELMGRFENVPEKRDFLQQNLKQHQEMSQKFSAMAKSAYTGIRRMEDGLTTTVSEMLREYEQALNYKLNCHEQYRFLFRKHNKKVEVTSKFIDSKLGCKRTAAQAHFINQAKSTDLQEVSFQTLEKLRQQYVSLRTNKETMESIIDITAMNFLSQEHH